jgi:hypothetical protein
MHTDQRLMEPWDNGVRLRRRLGRPFDYAVVTEIRTPRHLPNCHATLVGIRVKSVAEFAEPFVASFITEDIPLLGGRSVINFVYFRGIRLFFNDCARKSSKLAVGSSSLAAVAEEALQYDRRFSRRQLWKPLPRHAGRVRFSLDGDRGSEAWTPARLS